jgi:histidine triad (HIT) family protein
MASIFTKIINGDIPSYKIFEDDKVFAFLDIAPRQQGHCLIIPKIEVDYLFDLEDSYYQELFKVAKRLSKAIQKSTDCNRVSMTVTGFDVPHAHIHLIPTNKMDDMYTPTKSLSEVEMLSIQQKIINNLY